MPAIPTTIPDPTGFSGPFDDPQLAAAFGILGIFALFPLLRQKVHKFFRPLAMLGILSGGIIVGLAEQIGISLLLSSAAIILFFVTYKNENKEIQSSARLALVIALITPLLAFFGPKPPSIDSPINQTFGIAQMVNGEEPILTGENLPFYHETVANFALDGIPFGFGPDSYYAISEKYVDFNDAFARSNANNIPFGHRASRPILQLTGELGLFGLFLVLALFAFLLKNTFSTQNARSEKQIALFVAFSLFWIAPGLFGAAAMSALAAIFYGVTFDHSENTIPLVEEKTSVELSKNTEKTSNSELIPLKNWKGKYLFSTLILLTMTTSLFAQSQRSRNAYWFGKAVVFLDSGYSEQAQQMLLKAAEIEENYETLWNLALAHIYAPDELRNIPFALELVEQCTQLRPNHSFSRFFYTDLERRILPEDSNDEIFQTMLNNAESGLVLALEMNPNSIEATLALAQVHMVRLDSNHAKETLQQLANRNVNGEKIWRLYFELAKIYDEIDEDPERALEYYQRAAEHLPSSASAHQLGLRLTEMETWIEEGQRPMSPEIRHAPHDDSNNSEHHEHEH